jgi:hypothetical protein
MTMWAVMKSPLVLSTDLRKLSDATMNVATNRLAISVNQDRLAAQARRVRTSPPVGLPATPSLRPDVRDVMTVAALCDARRSTQRWLWSPAVDAPREPADSAVPTVAQNGTLWTVDEDGYAWCLTMPTSGIWGVVPYEPGNASHPAPCVDRGGPPSSWRAQEVGAAAASAGAGADADGAGAGGAGAAGAGAAGAAGRGEFAFIWRTGGRPYGFAWGQDPMSSGPLPHTRWLQSNAGGTWRGALATAASPGSHGVPFSPDGHVIDDDGVGGVQTRPGSDFCLDVVTTGNVETWVGPLAGGWAVAAVLNRSPTAQSARVTFAEAGLGHQNASRIAVHSAWGEAGSREGEAWRCEVPAHGAALLVLEVLTSADHVPAA